MPAHPETRPVSGGAKYVLYVTVYQVGGYAADGAEHVVMMPLVAELVSQFPIFQKHPANLIGFHQQAEATIHRGSANAGQDGAQLLRGEGTFLGGSGGDDQATGFGIPVALMRQLGNDVVHHGSGGRGGMVMPFVFCGAGNHFDTAYLYFMPRRRFVNPAIRLDAAARPAFIVGSTNRLGSVCHAYLRVFLSHLWLQV